MNLKALNEFEEEPGTKLSVVERTKSFLKLPRSKQEIILTAAIDYETMNQQEKLIKAQRDKMVRPIVETAADSWGIEDNNGHLHLVMEQEDGHTVEVVRTKKISRTMNQVAAEDILRTSNIWDSCVMQVISWEIDEEKVIAAYEAGLLSATDLDNMFTEKVTWATSVKTDVPQIKRIEETRKELEKAKPQGELTTIECS
jgi:hypothetical protein